MNPSSIKVDRLALEGDGVGRLDSGQVAFVAYTLPGDEVLAKSVAEKKNHSRWIPLSISKPSADRVVPLCPYHFKPGQTGPFCGGCNWQQMKVDQQRLAKRQLVIDSLERIGGFKNPPVGVTFSGQSEWRYRNKVQVPFGERDGQIVAGFYAPGSHTIVEFSDCLVQPEVSVSVVNAVKEWARAAHWKPYNEDAHQGWLRHLLVRSNEAGQVILALVTSDATFPDKHSFITKIREQCPQIKGIFQNIQRGKTNVVIGHQWINLWGADRLEEHVLGLQLAYSPGSFFQVNTKASEVLYEEAVTKLQPNSKSIVLDIYCGVGALTLLAAKKARFALGVELAPSSIRDARFNAKSNQIQNVKFEEASAEHIMGRGSAGLLRVAADEELLILLDPPRTGCEAIVLQGLLRLEPERIVYVSCNPATLARDLKVLAPAYDLKSVTPVDLFPQTSHIESVTCLERKN